MTGSVVGSRIRAGAAYVELAADNLPLTKGLRRAEKQLRDFGGRVKNLGATFFKWAALGGTPFALGGKLFMDFQRQMALVGTMMEKHEMHIMPKLAQAVRNYSEEYGESVKTLTRGLYDIRSAQIPASRALDYLREGVRGAIGGFTDAKTSISALITIMNAYENELRDVRDGMDFLFTVVKRGRLTYEDLATHIGTVAPVAAAAGVKLEEFGAALALITRGMPNVDRATIALANTIETFLKNEKSAKEAARALGIEMSTAGLKSRGLLDILRQLATVDPDTIAKIFPRRRALRGLVIALQKIKDLEADIDKITFRAGEADQAFAKVAKTVSFQWGRVRQTVLNMLREVGAALGGVALKYFKVIQANVKNIRQWLSQNHEVVRSIAKLVLLVGGLGVALISAGIAMRVAAAAVRGLLVPLSVLQTALVIVVGLFKGLFSTLKFAATGLTLTATLLKTLSPVLRATVVMLGVIPAVGRAVVAAFVSMKGALIGFGAALETASVVAVLLKGAILAVGLAAARAAAACVTLKMAQVVLAAIVVKVRAAIVALRGAIIALRTSVLASVAAFRAAFLSLAGLKAILASAVAVVAQLRIGVLALRASFLAIKAAAFGTAIAFAAISTGVAALKAAAGATLVFVGILKGLLTVLVAVKTAFVAVGTVAFSQILLPLTLIGTATYFIIKAMRQLAGVTGTTFRKIATWAKELFLPIWQRIRRTMSAVIKAIMAGKFVEAFKVMFAHLKYEWTRLKTWLKDWYWTISIAVLRTGIDVARHFTRVVGVLRDAWYAVIKQMKVAWAYFVAGLKRTWSQVQTFLAKGFAYFFDDTEAIQKALEERFKREVQETAEKMIKAIEKAEEEYKFNLVRSSAKVEKGLKALKKLEKNVGKAMKSALKEGADELNKAREGWEKAIKRLEKLLQKEKKPTPAAKPKLGAGTEKKPAPGAGLALKQLRLARGTFYEAALNALSGLGFEDTTTALLTQIERNTKGTKKAVERAAPSFT